MKNKQPVLPCRMNRVPSAAVKASTEICFIWHRMSREIGCWKPSSFLIVWVKYRLPWNLSYEHGSFLKEIYFVIYQFLRKELKKLCCCGCWEEHQFLLMNFLPSKDKLFVWKPYLYVATTKTKILNSEKMFSLRTWQLRRIFRFSSLQVSFFFIN